MKEYNEPRVELIKFDSEIVMGASGCNCIYDGWNNLQNSDECRSCSGGLWDAPEIFTDAPTAPKL